ncbi:pheromone-like protein [Mycena leptocephala]|jgi:hypothetical protein|nr:pheromone-like protein [Mycena leptocephala]
MDAFTTIEFLPTQMQTQPLAADVPISAAVQPDDDDSIRALVDEDTKVGFGGYCVVA